MPAYTNTDYETLVKSIAQGVTVVQYGDKRVEYRSLKEMLQIKSMMAAELGLNADQNISSRKFASFSKGI